MAAFTIPLDDDFEIAHVLLKKHVGKLVQCWVLDELVVGMIAICELNDGEKLFFVPMTGEHVGVAMSSGYGLNEQFSMILVDHLYRLVVEQQNSLHEQSRQEDGAVYDVDFVGSSEKHFCMPTSTQRPHETANLVLLGPKRGRIFVHDRLKLSLIGKLIIEPRMIAT